jgi:hypothetical protein
MKNQKLSVKVGTLLIRSTITEADSTRFLVDLLIKVCSTLYGTGWFVTVFTRARHKTVT